MEGLCVVVARQSSSASAVLIVQTKCMTRQQSTECASPVCARTMLLTGLTNSMGGSSNDRDHRMLRSVGRAVRGCVACGICTHLPKGAGHMSISICHGECYRDPDTGEIFCPCVPGGWVIECPKESCHQSRNGINTEEGEVK